MAAGGQDALELSEEAEEGLAAQQVHAQADGDEVGRRARQRREVAHVELPHAHAAAHAELCHALACQLGHL